jgi:hypothetical protein
VAEYRRTSDATVRDDSGELNRDGHDGKSEHDNDREIREIRATDIEPYTGLRYLSKLFRFMAVILLLLLVAEIVTGIYTQGAGSVPTLLGEASRLIVLAGVLWGTGDLAHLIIDVGHDVRAARILMARVAHAARLSGSGGPTRGELERMALDTTRVDRGADRVDERAAAPRPRLVDRPHDDDHPPPIP